MMLREGNGNDEYRNSNWKDLTRREVLRATATAGATVAGGSFIPTTSAAPAAIEHPGALHTQADFDRMASRVDAGAEPWLSGWNRLINNSHSHPTWNPNPQETIIRGGDGQNYGILYNDIHAAYQNALRWKIQDNTDHGDTARDILNAWSGTLNTVTGNADRFLAGGIYGYQFANAAEIMRGYSGFDLGRFQDMMLNVFYPLNDDFLVNHNDACITNYWANWDLCNMNSILAIGILCDDQSLIDRAVDYFKNGAGNGSIMNAVPFLHENGTLGQWQESGRDQGHTMMGVGQMGAFCEMAWNQGYDLYGYDNNRFMKACEYIAKYNLGNSVPFTTYNWGSGVNCDPRSHTEISSASRGEIRPVWERVYNHYAVRRGLSVPYTEQFAAEVRAEGGGGDYGSTSGGYDQLGFGTLTCTREASDTSPAIPEDTYRIENVNSGKVLDVADGDTADGANVQQWSNTGGDNQQFAVIQDGSNYRIEAVHSGRVLDVADEATADGANIHQWADSGGANQRFAIRQDGSGYRIVASHTGKVLDVADGDTADGANVQQWADHGGDNQRWAFHSV